MIEVTNLVKHYGDKKAVNDISFFIDEGEVVGFLGPNGAGKSTTMNIVTGYLSATSGSVKVAGIDILEDPIPAKKRLGYLPENPPLYFDMTVKEYLNFILEQLSELEGITFRPMMGEYILYMHGKIIGGIYDDRFLVKPTKSAMAMMPDAERELPYEGAKEMLLVDNVDNRGFLKELLTAMFDELPAPKQKRK